MQPIDMKLTYTHTHTCVSVSR